MIPGTGSSQETQTRMWNTRNQSVELTENIGLPPTLLESHNPWPAYVTYISPEVRRLVDKTLVQELECMQAAEENHKPMRLSKPSFMHLKRKKSSKSSELLLKDALSEARLCPWEPCSATNITPVVILEPTQSQMEVREDPTSNYNKIIFSRRPAMWKLPYGFLQSNKETHDKV
ncbi:CMT1A duplicated region transcript 4 protein isoform X2 [Mesocricetus auratus]|uniref:CMT1A duplicated region transcript 4 protein isoform X2 n=1 Tax=Mesocricetus auratus TaxID=10036 RepID=A0ABM2XMG2_MESAU|nr:CMT1A duplicated region transcript 4 protein isoform X2 [Mesocricetus auratus]